ncbi:MAG: PQQ-like beta-propeller repeat protein [Tannerella sp.]|jgi:outer membrane protein assembly factor BamB|nr:PQQ-like beta-propeller repeat protein [Tannerella sp.]
MNKNVFFITFFIAITLISCQQQNVSQGEASNSQWRGENRDGVYNETGLLKEWPADGPELLWSFEGLGAGFTSVAIANEKIYITGITDDNLMLYVFNTSGELLHTKVVGKEEAEKWPGTRSTVAVNEGKLYIFNAFGELFCLDEMTLNEVWKKNIYAEFEGVHTDWGYCESPLIVGEKLFITPGGEQHNMVALNKKTGDLIWSAPGEGKISAYCSPQYIDNQSIPIVVTSTAEYIIGVNADTGEKLWSFPQAHEYNIHPNTLLFDKDMVLSVTGYKVGSVMLRMKDGGKAVEEVWKHEVDNQMGGVIKVGDYIYTSGHQNRNWFCINWNTGETMYQVMDIAPCNVIFADGMLYCYSERGTMNLVKPNPEQFELVSNFNVELGSGTHWSHPVIHNGVLYLRHGDVLMAYKIN